MSHRSRSSRGERRSPSPAGPAFQFTAPDHSRPRHGKVLTKSVTPPPASRRRPRERRSSHQSRAGPSHRGSPPRDRPPPTRVRSPPRYRSPVRDLSPVIRQRSPLRGRSPPRVRSSPRRRSPIRRRSPPRPQGSPRRRSPVENFHRTRRHSPSYPPPLRTQSPPSRRRTPPPPRRQSPFRHHSPPSGRRHSPTRPRRHSPPPGRHRSPPPPRRRSPPPPRPPSPRRQASNSRYDSQVRHHRSRHERRLSPVYSQPNYPRDVSPAEAPRVPRDQRTPPQVQPPRPKHLRSPKREEARDRQKSSSRSRRSGEGRERSGSERREEISAKAPPPPAISSPESSLVQLSSQPSSFSSTGTSQDWGAVFRGPERDDVDIKELKRIQIDIRRNLPHPARSDLPVIRKFDRGKLHIVRRPGEGKRPIFSRDDVQANLVAEERPESREQKIQIKIAPLEEYERRLGGEIAGHEDKRRREESPRSGARSQAWETRNVRARLGGRELSIETERTPPPERRDVRERLGLSIKDRLGEQVRDEELEYRPRLGQRHFRGGRRGRGRGHRGRGWGSRSDDWKYGDKYQEEELPSSTTD